ncbi:MAG: glutathione S-transferase N-terminal domain-containing protein [Halothiobacillaceae bacterium]
MIRLFFRTVRTLLGPPLLAWERLTTPRGVQRSPEQQAEVDRRVADLALYQFPTCPFCIRVRRACKRLSLDIETRNALVSPHGEDLEGGGGERKVPCLRIRNADGSDTWMYESADIVAWLEREFGPSEPPGKPKQ